MPEPPNRTAACSCGQLRIVVAGAPERVSICHCRACQRRTGSVFGVQARWRKERVRIEGDSRVWRRIGAEGSAIDFRFCPHCGSTVWFTQDVAPALIAIAVGAFGDASFPVPLRSNYDAYRHPWVQLPPGIDRA